MSEPNFSEARTLPCPHQYSWRRNTAPESPNNSVPPVPFPEHKSLYLTNAAGACSNGSANILSCSLACLEHPFLPWRPPQAADSHPHSTLWPSIPNSPEGRTAGLRPFPPSRTASPAGWVSRTPLPDCSPKLFVASLQGPRL